MALSRCFRSRGRLWLQIAQTKKFLRIESIGWRYRSDRCHRESIRPRISGRRSNHHTCDSAAATLATVIVVADYEPAMLAIHFLIDSAVLLTIRGNVPETCHQTYAVLRLPVEPVLAQIPYFSE
jgi:hypothetical protein